MSIWIGENWFHNDFVASWKELFGYDAKAFVLDRDNFPVNIFFTMSMKIAPVLVSLARPRDGPVLSLAGLRAVGPLIAASALEESSTDFEAEGAVPGAGIITLEMNKFM